MGEKAARTHPLASTSRSKNPPNVPLFDQTLYQKSYDYLRQGCVSRCVSAMDAGPDDLVRRHEATESLEGKDGVADEKRVI